MACGDCKRRRGSLYSRGSKYMIPLVLFVKTMRTWIQSASTAMITSLVVLRTTFHTPKGKMPVIARHHVQGMLHT